MAEVPRYDQQNVRLTGNIPRATTDFSGVARGLAVAGKAIANRAERLRVADQQMFMVGMDNQFSDMRVKTMDLRGRATQGVTEQLTATKEKMYEDSVAKIDDPITKQNMDIYFEKSFGQQVTWTRNYEMKEGDVYLKEVDVAYRSNIARKLNSSPIGDYGAIDAGTVDATTSAGVREGPNRWSRATAANYHQATTDELYVGQVTRWFKEDADLAYKSFNANKEMLQQKLTPAAFNQLANLADAEYGTAKTLEIFKGTKAIFGNDSAGAALALSDPENLKNLGVDEADYKYANSAAVMFRSLASMNASLNKQQMDANADKASKAINEATAEIAKMTDPSARNASTQNLIKAIKQENSIPLDDRNKFIDNVLKGNYNSDPVRIAEEKAKIDSGETTRNYQISAQLGDSIGPDTKNLESYLQKKLTLEREGHINYVTQSKADFLRWAKAMKVPTDKQGLFVARLEAERKALGYLPNDPRVVTEIAPDLHKKEYYLPSTGETVEDTQYFRNEDERRVFETPTRILEATEGKAAVADVLKGQAMASEGKARYPAQQPPEAEVQTSGEVRIEPIGAAKGEAKVEPIGAAKGEAKIEPIGTATGSNPYVGQDADTAKLNAQKEERALNMQVMIANPWNIPGDDVDAKMSYINAIFRDIRGRDLYPNEQALIHMEIDRGPTR